MEQQFLICSREFNNNNINSYIVLYPMKNYKLKGLHIINSNNKIITFNKKDKYYVKYTTKLKHSTYTPTHCNYTQAPTPRRATTHAQTHTHTNTHTSSSC